MQASVLSSGSKGNCLYVEGPDGAVLVDCGITVPEAQRRLSAIGRDLSRVAAVLVTHDHSDHVGSSSTLARRLSVPLYATAGTHAAIARLPAELARTVRADTPFHAAGLEILPVATPHDGSESVCFRLTEPRSGRSLGVITDLGFAPRSLHQRFAGVHALVLEHNHDERMLAEGPYPQFLKTRIAGPRGHLSNAQGAALAAELLHAGLRRVVLAHLSETNNTPDLARAAFEKANGAAPAALALTVAEQHRPSAFFEV